MDWIKLVSDDRYGGAPYNNDPARSAFQRDNDRIVFSAAFRRLQDKTQVHPFPESDYIRRRLTHSLEVSCVGRSLGTAAGNLLKAEKGLNEAIPELPFTIGQIISNACLAHDIGNPPFGHAGEKAIGTCFEDSFSATLAKQLSPEQRSDLKQFEGNAQGFRLLTRLQEDRNKGGLKLTYATLGAFIKYPTPSSKTAKDKYVGRKKHGFFRDDLAHFEEIALKLGLPQQNGSWKRHPLVFLVEAADDICYRIIDVEDAFKLDRLDFRTAEGLLLAFIDTTTYHPVDNDFDNITWLRARAIGELIKQVEDAFKTNLTELVNGTFSKPLLADIQLAPAIKEAKEAVEKRVFNWDKVIAAEIAGVQMITDVLNNLIYALEKPRLYKSEKLLKIVPHWEKEVSGDVYKNLLLITDFVSGMTDTYLQKIHRRLTGQAIF